MRVQVLQDWQDILVSVAGRLDKKPLTLFVSAKKLYVVYGLSWHESSSAYGSGLFCEVVDDHGNLISAPVQIFDVIEGGLSASWRVEKRGSSVLMWPDLFLRQYFFDDLSEGVPEIVAEFSSLKTFFDGEQAP